MSGSQARDRRISLHELAERAGATPERIEALVKIGAIVPDADGHVDPNDVQRVSIVAAYEAGGISVADLATALRDGNMTFAYSASIYPPLSQGSDQTALDLASECDVRLQDLQAVYLALGLPAPDGDAAVTAEETQAVAAFFRGWSDSHLAPDAAVRAARIAGFAAHRLTDGWVDLFLDTVAMQPEERLRRRVEELGTEFFAPAGRVAEALEPLVAWLIRRHMERALNRVNVEFLEYALEQRGLRPAGARLPVIAFADLADFTVLTEVAGDAAAAANATKLGDIAVQAVTGRGGRLVKQLGDGVLLYFDEAMQAVEAVRILQRLAAEATLPPLHIGLAAGTVVQRDGDVYGRTVNLAARISAAADSGEVVANEILSRQLPIEFASIGAQRLKGFEVAVPLFRLLEPPPHG